ncbi:hypothetical protein AcV7_006438 [Taiwanofungus camphoratus]|nr:hypothetical protein AcV7_006438 [Antrodia cinnamomea]
MLARSMSGRMYAISTSRLILTPQFVRGSFPHDPHRVSDPILVWSVPSLHTNFLQLSLDTLLENANGSSAVSFSPVAECASRHFPENLSSAHNSCASPKNVPEISPHASAQYFPIVSSQLSNDPSSACPRELLPWTFSGRLLAYSSHIPLVAGSIAEPESGQILYDYLQLQIAGIDIGDMFLALSTGAFVLIRSGFLTLIICRILWSLLGLVVEHRIP